MPPLEIPSRPASFPGVDPFKRDNLALEVQKTPSEGNKGGSHKFSPTSQRPFEGEPFNIDDSIIPPKSSFAAFASNAANK